MGYIQRYPFAPKAEWWKRYTGTNSLGKRTIYLASQTLGFELVGVSNIFRKIVLKNGELSNCQDNVEYLNIATETVQDEYENIHTTFYAISFMGKLYMFNEETQTLDLEDFVVVDEENGEQLVVYKAELGDYYKFENNEYVRKQQFDCIKTEDQQSSTYQPIPGLVSDSTFLTIKTHNFCESKEEPSHEDLVFYQGSFWVIEDTRKTYRYEPKEKSTLYLSLKKIK